MTESEDKCEYCGQKIMRENMAHVEVNNKAKHKPIHFCDEYCRIASHKEKKNKEQ